MQDIKYQTNSTNQLSSSIDRSSLKIERIKILERGTETVVTSSGPVYVKNIDETANTLSDLENTPTLNPNTKYDVRRKLNESQSKALPDVLNLYVDKDEYAYM